MNMILAVASGGAVGAVARLLLSKGMLNLFGPGGPWGTLAVNLLGSFMIGLLIEIFASRVNISHEWQAFIIIGFLGGFTTFSSFTLEVGLMIEKGQLATAMFYALGSIFIGVVALFAGLYAGKAFI
jgi:CrcB protein